MNYRSVADMNSAIVFGLSQIPTDIDLVVGIPRSGMLAASLVALHRNLPLADLNGFLEGRILQSGNTGRLKSHEELLKQPRKVLVIDDSLYHGYAMGKAKEAFRAVNISHDVLFGVVFLLPGKERHVDIFFERLEVPRVFEWNLMAHEILARTCFDMDGVLCRDPTAAENDDGPAYLRFIEKAEPLWLPRRRVGWIVTSRLEKYRQPTVDWLTRQGVAFENLIMLNLPDKESRLASNCHASFKGDFYRSVNADMFVESSLDQSIEIANISKKNVLCVETGEMLQASMLNEYRMRIKSIPKTLRPAVVRSIKGCLRRVPGYGVMRKMSGR